MELKEAQQAVEEAQRQLEQAQAELERAKENDLDFEQGDYVLYSNANIVANPFNGSHISAGSTFKTKEQAKQMRELQFIQRVLFHAAIKYNEGWEPNWGEHSQKKWFINYNHEKKDYTINFVRYMQRLESVPFETEAIAKKALAYLKYHLANKPWED